MADKRPTRAEPPPVKAWLTIEGWHGSTTTEVALVGMTKHRFRIRALRPTRLAGRGRVLDAGHEALVPKTAVRQTGGGLFKPGELPEKRTARAPEGLPPARPKCRVCRDELGPEDEDDEEGRCAGCALAALENDPNYCGECNASPCACERDE